MEIRIHPADLLGAAAALVTAAHQLESASLEFRRRACEQIPDLGLRTGEATAQGVVATDHAVEAFADDLVQLAHAIRGLAAHYPQVDRSAVASR
jgi:hypothetical protein